MRLVSREWGRPQQIFTYLALLVLALIAMGLVYRGTPFGVAVGHDSLFYLTTGQNIAQLKGVYWTGSGGALKPLNHFPPLYPLLLAIPAALGLPITASARLLAVLFSGLNVLLLGIILIKFSRNLPVAIIGILTIFFSPVVFQSHLEAMSEPVFFFFMLLAFAGLTCYLADYRQRDLLFAAGAAALASLTRWVGIGVLGTMVIGLVLFGQETWSQRLKSSLRALVVGLPPLLLWLLRNRLLTGTFTNRTFGMHLINADTIRMMLDTIYQWVTPRLFSHWLQAAILLVLVVLCAGILFWNHRRHRKPLAGTMAALLLVFVALYLSQLLVSLSFFDASTRIDNRILSPVFLAFMLIFWLGIGLLPARVGSVVALGIFALGLLGPVTYMWESTAEQYRSMRQEGGGFSSRDWQESHLIQWIIDRDEGIIVVSNQSAAVRFLTGVPAIQLPERMDPVRNIERPEYKEQLEDIDRVLDQPGAYLVFFSPRDLSIPVDMNWLSGLTVIYSNAEGAVYSSGG